MNDKHRNRILQNLKTLIDQTDLSKLSQACLEYGLLTHVMLININSAAPQKTTSTSESESEWNEERDRHRRLFVKITKRGPEAFEILRAILRDLGYRDALETLDGNDKRMISIIRSKKAGKPMSSKDLDDDDDDDDNNTGNLVNNNHESNNNFDRQFSRSQLVDDSEITLHEYEGPITPKKNIIVQKAKAICKSDKLATYPMESKTNRGVFFLVNIIDFHSNKKREGSDEDAYCLLKLFKELGFKLYAYTNLTRTSFFRLLDELLALEEIKSTECFAMALMTHGHLDGGVQRISFTDSSLERVAEIEKRFYNQNCPNLIDKPKIFIYPYCRGANIDRGVPNPNAVSKTQTEGSLLNYTTQLSDVIKCYATTEGNPAHRDRVNGSWYIQRFVDTVAKYACDTSFEEMLKIIQHNVQEQGNVEGYIQTASYVNIGFNKEFYFNPGV